MEFQEMFNLFIVVQLC